MEIQGKELSYFTEALQKCKPELRERYKVKSLGIFGSYVRNKQQSGSDLDVLVDFDEAPSLFEFLRLENALSDLLGVKVDLVMRDSLRRNIGQQILRETVGLWGSSEWESPHSLSYLVLNSFRRVWVTN
jgi:predicted nucleotidyltransferase